MSELTKVRVARDSLYLRDVDVGLADFQRQVDIILSRDSPAREVNFGTEAIQILERRGYDAVPHLCRSRHVANLSVELEHLIGQLPYLVKAVLRHGLLVPR